MSVLPSIDAAWEFACDDIKRARGVCSTDGAPPVYKIYDRPGVIVPGAIVRIAAAPPDTYYIFGGNMREFLESHAEKAAARDPQAAARRGARARRIAARLAAHRDEHVRAFMATLRFT
jgi:hypothetical protein